MDVLPTSGDMTRQRGRDLRVSESIPLKDSAKSLRATKERLGN